MLDRFKSKLIEKKSMTKDVLFLKFEKPDNFKFVAGQFVNIKIEERGVMRMRAYSICSSNDDGYLGFCVKLVEGGFASKIFNDSKEGDEFEIVAPFGSFKFDANSKKHVFIGAGTGVAPFYSIIKENYDSNYDFTLLMSYKKKENVLFDEFFSKLSMNDNFDYKVTLTQDSWQGLVGRVQKHLTFDLSNTTFYICGLKELVLETKQFLLDNNVSKERIRIERYN